MRPFASEIFHLILPWDVAMIRYLYKFELCKISWTVIFRRNEKSGIVKVMWWRQWMCQSHFLRSIFRSHHFKAGYLFAKYATTHDFDAFSWLLTDHEKVPKLIKKRRSFKIFWDALGPEQVHNGIGIRVWDRPALERRKARRGEGGWGEEAEKQEVEAGSTITKG